MLWSFYKDRYYNWYHGYTEIKLPYYDFYDKLSYDLNTAASSGSINTQHFGEDFDADKVEKHLIYEVYVYPPASVGNNTNVTLHIDVEMVSIKDMSSGQDTLSVDFRTVKTSHKSFNFSLDDYFPSDYYQILFRRDVLPADVTKQKLELMPGFKATWHYSGDVKVEPEARYYNRNKAFIRYYSNHIILK